MADKRRVTIEFPSRGATYNRQVYGVYAYDTYPRTSVLAGQQRRTFINSYETLAEARVAHPDAKESGCGFQPPDLSHLPDGPDI